MRFWMVLFLFFCLVVQAGEPLYPFETEAQHARFQTWTERVRCVVCQAQSLSESNVPLAMDLKQKIAEFIRQEKSDADIKLYLVTRYGERILYLPSVSSQTFLLWALPILAMIGCVFWMTRK